MQDLQIWITYHDDSQIEDFGLAEDDVFRLFKGNDTHPSAHAVRSACSGNRKEFFLLGHRFLPDTKKRPPNELGRPFWILLKRLGVMWPQVDTGP